MVYRENCPYVKRDEQHKTNPVSDDTGPFVIPLFTFSHRHGVEVQVAFDRQTHWATEFFQLFK